MLKKTLKPVQLINQFNPTDWRVIWTHLLIHVHQSRVIPRNGYNRFLRSSLWSRGCLSSLLSSLHSIPPTLPMHLSPSLVPRPTSFLSLSYSISWSHSLYPELLSSFFLFCSPSHSLALTLSLFPLILFSLSLHLPRIHGSPLFPLSISISRLPSLLPVLSLSLVLSLSPYLAHALHSLFHLIFSSSLSLTISLNPSRLLSLPRLFDPLLLFFIWSRFFLFPRISLPLSSVYLLSLSLSLSLSPSLAISPFFSRNFLLTL